MCGYGRLVGGGIITLRTETMKPHGTFRRDYRLHREPLDHRVEREGWIGIGVCLLVALYAWWSLLA